MNDPAEQWAVVSLHSSIIPAFSKSFIWSLVDVLKYGEIDLTQLNAEKTLILLMKYKYVQKTISVVAANGKQIYWTSDKDTGDMDEPNFRC